MFAVRLDGVACLDDWNHIIQQIMLEIWAVWQNLWVKMALLEELTARGMRGFCAKTPRQGGRRMSFSLWPVACKGIPVGGEVVTTCSSAFPLILGRKTWHLHHDGTLS